MVPWMSDFGTMIIIRRLDGASVSSLDRAAVESATAPLRTSEEHCSTLGEPFLFRLGEATLETGARGLSLLLSEYWLGEDEDGEDEGFAPDAVLAEDRRSAGPVLEQLRGRLIERRELEVVADHW